MLANEMDASGPGSRPIQLKHNLETVIPKPLLPLLLEQPFVRFMVTVNEEGKLVDFLAVESTHHGLLERAEKTLQTEAEFSPGLDQGKPVQASGEVTVYFYDPEQEAIKTGVLSRPYGQDASEAVYRRLYVNNKERYIYRLVTAAELKAPVVLREGKIMVLTDATGRPAAGECVVEFFIDSRGDVRMPHVVQADNDTVALSALMTLRHTHYAPILRADGVPAYVKVRQPMSFAPPAATEPLVQPGQPG
jgi:hypothetical protein